MANFAAKDLSYKLLRKPYVVAGDAGRAFLPSFRTCAIGGNGHGSMPSRAAVDVSGMVLTLASRRFNTSCFWRENVVYLHYGSAGAGKTAPFLVPYGLLSGKTVPMTGKNSRLVVFPTWLVVSPVPVWGYKKIGRAHV